MSEAKQGNHAHPDPRLEEEGRERPGPAIEADHFERQRRISRQLASPSLEGYEILAYIGEGTYGDVWQAKDKKTGTVVAIKRLRKQPDQQSRSEVRMLAGLDAARGIVALKNIHLDSEPYCYVMEYMSGGTLADRMNQRGGKVPFREAWRIFRELTDALAYVHRQGTVHCDIKPENVLLDTQGRPRLSDFGQARGQGPRGSSLGTRFYMPPEQARLDAPDARWDVYGLGAILYQMLTGKKPRYSPQLAEQMNERSHSGSEVRDRLEQYAEHLESCESPEAHRGLPGVTPEAAALIERCLEVDAAVRPKDAAELLAQIERCEWRRRRRPLLILGGVAPALTLLAAGLVVIFGGILALQEFQGKWAAQVVGGNQVIARSVATEIESRFNERMRVVRQEAQDPQWAELLSGRGDEDSHARLQEKLQGLYQTHSGLRVRSWMVADAEGRVRLTFGRMPAGNIESDVPPEQKNFAWREWFNGVEDKPVGRAAAGGEGAPGEGAGDDGEKLLSARRDRGHVVLLSQPHLRDSTDPGKELWVVSTSSIIPPQADAAPMGVLAAQIDYREFNESFARFGTQAFQRKVIVANERGQAFYHGEVAEGVKRNNAAIAIPQIDLERPEHDFFVEAFAMSPAAAPTPNQPAQTKVPVTRTDPWNDEKDHTQYYISRSAAHLANGQKLAIFILHDKEVALAGFVAAERQARWLGITLFGVGCLFLIGNVWVLRSTLRHEEKHDNG